MNFGKKLLAAATTLTLCFTMMGTVLAKDAAKVAVKYETIKLTNTKNAECFLEIKKPRVDVLGNYAAEKAINDFYEKEYIKNLNLYKEQEAKDEILSRNVSYELSYQNDKFVIFTDKGYDFYWHAAHPLSWEHSQAFNLETGSPVSWQELIAPKDKDKVSILALNKKLSKHKEAKMFFEQPTRVEVYPPDYAVDKNGGFHFLFMQYHIAPYAAGIIDVNMGIKIVK